MGVRVNSRWARPAALLTVGDPLLDLVVDVGEDFLAARGIQSGGCVPADDCEEVEALLNAAVQEGESAAEPQRRPGGSAANVARMVARLGGGVDDVRFVGAVGADTEGREYCEGMERCGVDVEHVAEVDGTLATGRCLCLVEPDGERTMRPYLGAASAVGADAVAAAAKGVSICHFEGYALYKADLVANAVAGVREQAGGDVLISIDLGSRDLVEQRFDELESVLSSGFVDIIFSNEEEARVVATRVDFDTAEGGATDDPELMRAITYLTDACPTLAVVSLGARGCLVASRRNGVPPTFMRTVPVRRLVDSVGCGDAFTAGILWATVQGADPIRAIKVGTACGAAAATSRGSEVDDAAMEVVRWVADGRVARSTFAAASS